MADVTATEVGTKKISLTITAGLYSISRLTDYFIRLNASRIIPPPLFTITDAQPTPVVATDDPSFVLTGTGFQGGPFNLFAFGASSFGTYQINAPDFTIDSDTQITVNTGLLPTLMGLPFATPPLTFVFIIAVGIVPAATSPAVSVTAVAPDPMDDAQFLAFTGGPQQIPITVGTRTLQALESAIDPGLDGAYTYLPLTPPGGPGAEYTFAAWVRKVDPTFGTDDLLLVDINPAFNASMRTGAIETVEGRIHSEIVTDPAFAWWNTSDWHLIVLSKAADGVMRLYRDGALVTTSPPYVNRPWINPTATARVGGIIAAFGSMIGSPAAWTRQLSDSEVATLYAETTFPP